MQDSRRWVAILNWHHSKVADSKKLPVVAFSRGPKVMTPQLSFTSCRLMGGRKASARSCSCISVSWACRVADGRSASLQEKLTCPQQQLISTMPPQKKAAADHCTVLRGIMSALE